MSFCPSDDIHSVYLDGELPENFKSEYESHLQSCSECQKKLDQLKKLHALFEADSKALDVDKHYLDQSFDRLMVKMNYEKHTSRKPVENHRYWNLGLVSVGAAAVLAFALIVPIRVSETSKSVAKAVQKNQQYAALSAQTLSNNVEFDSGRSVVISGNIDKQALASVSSKNANSQYVQNVSSRGNVSSMSNRNMIEDVGVFNPDFYEQSSVKFRVVVPGMEDIIVGP